MQRKVYFDLTTLASTSAGSSVHAWELCHRLMRIARPLQVIPFTSPFRTDGRKGWSRAFNALLRDTVWQNLLLGMEATDKDYFIFNSPLNVPQKFFSLKYAIFVHDLGAWHERSYLNWRGRMSVKSIPEALANADIIFAVSDYTAKDIVNEFKIDEKQIVVAPNGLSEMYKFDAAKLESINGVKLPEQYFLHVGTFEPKKNLPFLLKVYERFREIAANSKKSIKLLLTGGESWKSSELLNQINNSLYAKDIIVLGRVKGEELPSLYRGAIAFIFPSVFEGFGIPVIEALSQGIPVFVNSNTSLTQFSNFGATMLDNFDPDIWAKELKEVVQKTTLEQSYIERVRNYFDWDKTANIVAETINLN